ncbi:MAG: ABC transporter permease [Bacteroidota bacterium]
MRSFAEEKKLGTLELLMTKPLTELDIVLGKFFAAFMLVIVSLAPTLIYYITLYQLGNPEGNIDTPGVIGSFTGMILLGGVFCSIGVLSSSITSNQIVSFIIAAFFCYAFYTGVDSLASLFSDGRSSLFVRQFGILYHYESLSKGLIDSRDLVYFFSIAGTYAALHQNSFIQQVMVKWESKKLGDLLLLANGLIVAIVLSQLASIIFSEST